MLVEVVLPKLKFLGAPLGSEINKEENADPYIQMLEELH